MTSYGAPSRRVGTSPHKDDQPAVTMTRMDVEPLRTEVHRVADRLRSMSQERLSRPFPPYASRAAAALVLAQLLADTAADLEAVDPRTLPDLGSLAVGDQVAVTGTDVVTAAYVLPGPGDPRVQRCLDALAELRRAL
jgi:hypothetical protein